MFERITRTFRFALDAAGGVFGIRSLTEEPNFTQVAQLGSVEIRRYGARLAADTVVSGAAEAARGRGFERLAGYIFGGNDGGRPIAMTAPVALRGGETIAMTAPVAQFGGDAGAGEGRWTVRFFLPADRTRATLPKPNDGGIEIVDVPAATMAVLRFSGVPSATAVAAQRAALLEALAGSAWQVTGPVEDWFFDPPWTLPPLRRNEVTVPVTGPG